MQNKGNSTDQPAFNKLKRSYIIALSAIAVSVIIGQIFILKELNTLEASEKINKLQTLSLSLSITTLLIVIAVLFFIFLPSLKSIKNKLTQLSESEKQAKKTAYDADQLSITKEKLIKEQKAFSYAMDETLLFARITTDGVVIHIGNKFSKFLKFNTLNTNINLSTILSNDKKEQSVIDDIINKHKRTGWQGEIKGTSKSNNAIWLEMSIIPFNPTIDRSELLIIASEITKRKTAQLEIDRLTKESFEEKMNQQKIISSKIIENQENEQNRIAKDVHDGIGQMLTGLKFNLESIDTSNIEKTTSKIEALKALTLDIIKGVRTATFNLTPPELSDHGIVPALTKLTKELSKLTGKNIDLLNKNNFNERLGSLTEINIYRITQESINNAIKYADSTHILVTLSNSENILSISIDDNGKGFDPDKIKKPKTGEGGMGMTFMQERIKYINGRLFLSSELGKGTRVTLNIPINQ